MKTPLKTYLNNRKKIALAIFSGLLLTAAFPKIGIVWLAWIALVPLLLSLRNVSWKERFRFGFITGLAHYMTLVYWVAYTMKIYGELPLYLCIPVLFLFAAYLALYIAGFSLLTGLWTNPLVSAAMIPVSWTATEYLRSFLFTGIPWELLGYSQFNRLYLIQIADITGVYGLSFLIAMTNAVIFSIFLYLIRNAKPAPEECRPVLSNPAFFARTGKACTPEIPKRLAIAAPILLILIFAAVCFYGKWRIDRTDRQIASSRSVTATVVQGNIDQHKKWDPAFQIDTVQKYIRMSLSAETRKPDLVVWPETAAPFYFLHNKKLTDMIFDGTYGIGANFLIGSPSFVRGQGDQIEYYNSAYLINRNGEVTGKYDKVHLVPFGEYVPLKKWLPFIGKIVENIGDFSTGNAGNTIRTDTCSLGILICYEIIFPNLAVAMAVNDADLLVNITNDAWYGTTSAPYQHFSMSIFRAVENRRSLIRSANTGISGFIDPAGRVIGKTALFKDAVLTRSVPIMQEKTVYTRYGDVFADICLVITAVFLLIRSAKIPFWHFRS